MIGKESVTHHTGVLIGSMSKNVMKILRTTKKEKIKKYMPCQSMRRMVTKKKYNGHRREI